MPKGNNAMPNIKATNPNYKIDLFALLKSQKHDDLIINENEIITLLPWVELSIGNFKLKSGWYICEVKGAKCALNIEGFAQKAQEFIEFSIDEENSVFSRIMQDDFKFTIRFGARPAKYQIDTLFLRKLNVIEVAIFLIKRGLITIFVDGGFKKLYSRIKQILFSKSNFGAAKGAKQSLLLAGPLARFDYSQAFIINEMQFVKSAIYNYSDLPKFVIITNDNYENLIQSLSNQIYPHWRIANSIDKDEIVVEIRDDCRLTPDALFIIAQQIIKNPKFNSFTANGYFDKIPCNTLNPSMFIDNEYVDSLPVFICKNGINSDKYNPNLHFHIDTPIYEVNHKPKKLFDIFYDLPQKIEPLSVIIPTRDRVDLLRNCVNGLLEKVTNIGEIIIVDNGSIEIETFDYFKEIGKKGVRIIGDDGDFNFSRLCNFGAKNAKFSILAFLNNDIEVISGDFLARLSALACLPQFGAIGTKLLFSDKSLQHGGVALGLGGTAGHWLRFLPKESHNEFPELNRRGYRSAVTGAVLVVEAQKFWKVGGFDEKNFPVTLNDIDLCLKLNEIGAKTIYAPDAVAYHLEGASRGLDIDLAKRERRAKEVLAFRKKWEKQIENDNWASKHYSHSGEFPILR